MRNRRKKNMKKKRSARKGARLGQHFLKGTWAAEVLARAVDVKPNETILEIGPGKGALTKELLATGATVIAIEKDEALVTHLEETFRSKIEFGKLILVSDDIRNFDPQRYNLIAGSYVLAANIPYYITGEIIRQFLETSSQPRALALLVQKEVADRIVARNGKESILSLSVKAYGIPKIIAKVSRGNFSPPPSVDSAILLIDNVSKKFFDTISEERFFEVIHAGFTSKRKFLANNLGVRFEKDRVAAVFNAIGILPAVRAEDVPLDAWKQLVSFLVANY